MTTLLDTNVLLRSAEPAHPQHEVAKRAVDVLLDRREVVCLIPQVLYEFWVVATRPVEQNGLGLSTGAAHAEIARLERVFPVLLDSPELFAEWKRLVTHYDVKGKNAHDARIVAAMKVHAVTMLLSFNTQDFNRFTEIRLVSPQEVLSSAP